MEIRDSGSAFSAARRAALFALAGCCAWGQARPAFEVASIKPASRESRSAGVAVAAGYARYNRMSVGNLICAAYGVQRDQVSGPAWMMDMYQFGFDIEAKLPAGADPAQAPLMLQTLLEERFALRLRKVNRERDGYALLVAKGGPALSRPSSAPAPQSTAGAQPSALRAGAGGGFVLRQGAVALTVFPDRILVETKTIAGLVEFLWQRVGAPVADLTGLSGEFDIRLTVETASLSAAAASSEGLTPDERTRQTAIAVMDGLRATCIRAVTPLGLELSRRKIPVETLEVDHVEKAPSEN